MPKIRLTREYKKDSGRVLPVGTLMEVTVEFATLMVKEKKAVISKEVKVKQNRKLK